MRDIIVDEKRKQKNQGKLINDDDLIDFASESIKFKNGNDIGDY